MPSWMSFKLLSATLIAIFLTIMPVISLPSGSATFDSSQSGGSMFSAQGPSVPTVNPILVPVIQGESNSVEVSINNSHSDLSWIVQGIALSTGLPHWISITAKNFIPFASQLPSGSVISPFSLTVQTGKSAPVGNYTLTGFINLRTSLLPPYTSVTIAFNITVLITPASSNILEVELILLDSGLILADCVVIIVMIDLLLRRISL